MPPTKPTAEESAIAKWMFDEFTRIGRLYQAKAVYGIRQKFGEGHLYKNDNGNWAINRTILEEFKKLVPEDRVWSRSHQFWRKRLPTDPAGTSMVR